MPQRRRSAISPIATASASPRRRTISGTASDEEPVLDELGGADEAVRKRIAVGQAPGRERPCEHRRDQREGGDERPAAAPRTARCRAGGLRVIAGEHDDPRAARSRARSSTLVGAGAARQQIRVVALVDAQQAGGRARGRGPHASTSWGGGHVHGCSYTDDSDGLAGPQASGSNRCRALRWHGGRDPRHADRRSRSRAGSVRPVDPRARNRELRPAPARHDRRGGDRQVRLPLHGDERLGEAAWALPRRARSSSGAAARSRRWSSSSSCRSRMPSSASPT